MVSHLWNWELCINDKSVLPEYSANLWHCGITTTWNRKIPISTPTLAQLIRSKLVLICDYFLKYKVYTFYSYSHKDFQPIKTYRLINSYFLKFCFFNFQIFAQLFWRFEKGFKFWERFLRFRELWSQGNSFFFKLIDHTL